MFTNLAMGMILLVPTAVVFWFIYSFATQIFENNVDPERQNWARTRFVGLLAACTVVVGGWYVVMNLDRWEEERAQRWLESHPAPYVAPIVTSSTDDETDDTSYEDYDSECGYGGWGC